MRTFNVRLFYVFKFMSQCLPVYAFYTVLFIERGMTVSDIAVLMALWSVFTVVFEVPSGVLADNWNRRNMLVLAAMLQGVCFIIWFFSHTMIMFAVGFVFWAIAAAFTSGTEEGLIYDNLKFDGCAASFTRVYGKARFCASAGTIVGVVSAGILAGFISVEMTALISAAICFGNAVLVMQIREKNYYSERIDKASRSLLGTFNEAVVLIKGSRTVRVCILLLVFFVSLGYYLDEYDALIIKDFKLDNSWVSVILTVRFIFTAAGNALALTVQKRLASIRQIFLLDGCAGVFMLIFAVIWSQYAILLFGIALMVMSISEILLVNILQNEINAAGRATIMSFYGMGQNLVMIAFSLIYALLAGAFNLRQVYIILSIYGIVGAFGCCFVKTRSDR